MEQVLDLTVRFILGSQIKDIEEMSRGTRGQYWANQALPSVFKHGLLEKYVPQFAGMTGSKSLGKRVVFLDGFAGRGRYEDGSPASAERVLRMAQSQRERVNLAWSCFFVEAEEESAAALTAVVNEYRAQGVSATAHHGNVLDVLDDVVAAASKQPLFLFLDPCGLGIPYERLTSLLSGPRQSSWPPTEILLNFSLDAVRRIGGHVTSSSGNPNTMLRLDEALGGQWWRDRFVDGVSDLAVEHVVRDFCDRLRRDTGMNIVTVPVERAPNHKPVYHLTFGTRRQHGLWVFGDSVARATQEWWDTLEEVEIAQEPGTLFTVSSAIRPVLATVEDQAVPVIAENIANLLVDFEQFTVVEHAERVFGDYYGLVRDSTVRRAVKLLNAQGRTISTGVGSKPRDLVVKQPVP